jgi:hypothetical protein
VIDGDKGVADDREVEKESPDRVFRLQSKLVVTAHDAKGDKVGEYQATEDDEDVLWNEAPWRVAGSEEGRLQPSAYQLRCGSARSQSTDVILHRVWPWKAAGGREKRCRVHGYGRRLDQFEERGERYDLLD